MLGLDILFLNIGTKPLFIGVHVASFQYMSRGGVCLLTSRRDPWRRRILHHQECLRTTSRGVGVRKIGSEPGSISRLQRYLLSFWAEANISLDTEEEFLRAGEMS